MQSVQGTKTLTNKAQNVIIKEKKEGEKMQPKTSEAKRKAIYKYDNKFERINCRLDKGTRERIERLGYKSANDFIKIAVYDKLEKEEKYLKKGTK